MAKRAHGREEGAMIFIWLSESRLSPTDGRHRGGDWVGDEVGMGGMPLRMANCPPELIVGLREVEGGRTGEIESCHWLAAQLKLWG